MSYKVLPVVLVLIMVYTNAAYSMNMPGYHTPYPKRRLSDRKRESRERRRIIPGTSQKRKGGGVDLMGPRAVSGGVNKPEQRYIYKDKSPINFYTVSEKSNSSLFAVYTPDKTNKTLQEKEQ